MSTQVRIDDNLHKQLKEIYERDGVRIAESVRRALVEHLARVPASSPLTDWGIFVKMMENVGWWYIRVADEFSKGEIFYNPRTGKWYKFGYEDEAQNVGNWQVWLERGESPTPPKEASE